MQRVREWLITQGVDPNELDQFVEQPVIRDIGNGILLSLQNDDDIGNMLITILTKVDDLTNRIQTLEAE